MKLVIQRVKRAGVKINSEIYSQIGEGLLLLLGIGIEDNEQDIDFLINKTVGMRIFQSEKGEFDLSVSDLNKEVLIVSQFTLYGDMKKGKRPSFAHAAPPQEAKKLYNAFVEKFKETGLAVKEGKFQAMMDVESINDGPVTLILDSKNN